MVPDLLPTPPAAAARDAQPPLARAWARALVMHWGRLERLGRLDVAQPVYVLDLAPGDGTLARAALAEIGTELQARGMLGWLVRYVACLPGGAAAHACWSDAALQDWSERGVLQAGSWPAHTGRPLLLGPERLPLFGARNPVAALSAGGLCIEVVDTLADFSAGRYLLIATGGGARAVQWGLLAWHQRNAGARVATLQCGGCGLVLQLACRDDLAPPGDAAWAGLLQCAGAHGEAAPRHLHRFQARAA